MWYNFGFYRILLNSFILIHPQWWNKVILDFARILPNGFSLIHPQQQNNGSSAIFKGFGKIGSFWIL